MVRTNKSARYPPPPIFPIVRSDIPAIVQVWISATRPDLLLRIQESDVEKLTELLTRYMTAYFDGGAIILKAVDWRDAERITAVAIWVKRGFSLEESGMDNLKRIANEATLPPRLCGGVMLDKCTQDESPPPISKFLSEKVREFAEAWTDGIKHIELELLMTDPAFQRRGIGTALLRWGHELADQEAVPCFLCSSPFGHPLYQSLGWKHVAEPVVVDLKEFVQFAEKGDMGWGVYKLYFMLRLPRTKEVDN
jgi:GNAT superfamily N-acetyltransferase